MASVSHHPNVHLMTYSEVDGIVRNADGSFAVDLHKKSSYVDFDACTGCGKCEEVCTVTVPDQYNYDLVTRRIAHIPFPQAVPKKAVINRRGEAPCTFTCPANVKASGYVSLVRAGRYEEAFNLHLENAPLVGSLTRALPRPVRIRLHAWRQGRNSSHPRRRATWRTATMPSTPNRNTVQSKTGWTRA